MKEYIQKLVDGKRLTPDESGDAMRLIMSGEASQAQIGSFLTALRLRGETVEDVTAFARVMREFCHRIRPNVKGTLVDMCGTGGDAIKTFNVSTTASFVVSGAGVPIAKHGNRSVTSKSGSADILEALGIRIDLRPERVCSLIEDVGFGFMFAPVFHSAMKHAIAPRKEVGIRTVFNILGPLTNPACAEAQLVGVFDPGMLTSIAQVLANMGVRRAVVVHGDGGLDEVSTFGKTYVSELKNGKIETYEVTPEDFGIKRSKPADLAGGDAKANAAIALDILNGRRGPMRDIVALNAACGIYAGGRAASIKEGLEKAVEAIDSGKAMGRLNEYARRSTIVEALA
jgi:anthranilate phosphoribosyltransferase